MLIIDSKEDIHYFEGLILILKNDSKDELDSWIEFGRLFIQGENTETDFMLRVTPNLLTIARIKVVNKRVGVGTEVLSWLKAFAVKHGFEKIRIEQATTDSIKSFANKHKFKLVYDDGIGQTFDLNVK